MTLSLIDENFPLFSSKPPRTTTVTAAVIPSFDHKEFVKDTQSSSPTTSHLTFSNLGLSDWALKTCTELGLKSPTPVQRHCIPRILAGDDVLGLAQTGSGKTAPFALPILHRLSENPYGVFCLVITPTRELAYQLVEQFKALGSCLNVKCEVVGGMDMITQSKKLLGRPHVVIATPGRIKVLIEQDSYIANVFSNTK